MKAEELEGDAPIFGIVGRIEGREAARLLELGALVHEACMLERRACYGDSARGLQFLALRGLPL